MYNCPANNYDYYCSASKPRCKKLINSKYEYRFLKSVGAFVTYTFYFASVFTLIYVAAKLL